jgi:O-antigen/teichoic acid export membrane protein
VRTESLKQRFIRGSSWTLAGYALSQVIRLASSLILTRLLAPDIYGVMTIGYMVVTGLVMFSDIGLAQGAIQNRRGDDPTYLNVAWLVQIARGLLIGLLALAISAALASHGVAGLLPGHSVYADQRVPAMLAAVALLGPISGLESTKVFLARRQLALAQLVRIDLGAQLSGTLFTIAWAMVSPSIWALTLGWLFGALVKTILTHVRLPGPPNRLQWDRAAFGEVYHFGKWALLSSAFTFLLSSGDRLLFGALIDATELGLYSIAMLLLGAVQAAVGKVGGYAVLPALSEVARERASELKSTLYRIRWPLDVLCLLLAGALFFLSDAIVRLLYDARYAGAGWILGLVSITLVATRLDVFDQCLVAQSRIRALSALNAIRLVTLYTLLPAGFLVAGFRGAVAAVALSALVNSAFVLTLQSRAGLVDWTREAIAIPLLGAGFIIGWALRHAIQLAA